MKKYVLIISKLLFTLVLGSLTTSAYASLITIEAEDLTQVSRFGSWGVFSGAVLQEGQGLESFTSGSSLNWSFESISGGGLSIFGEIGPNRGIFELAVDGSPIATADTFNTTFFFQQELLSISGLTAGIHNATLTVNTQIIAVDFFEYDGVTPVPVPGAIWLFISGLIGFRTTVMLRKA